MVLNDFPVKTVQIGESAYPKILSLIPNPPNILYFRGNLGSHLFDNCLGIVGSRRISPYGIAVLGHLFNSLDYEQITTVSGFMRGVDITAHALSVEYSVPTVAVLPCGIEEIYPNLQMNLYQKILAGGGLILSEYPKNEKSKNWMFVKRNRIIAGLCSCLLVVEAGKNSGSLITYGYAKKYGKKILTVPGDIFREGQQGICQILREYARPVFSGSDINAEMGIKISRKTNFGIPKLDSKEEIIFNSIGNNPIDLNGLSRKVNLPVSNLSTFITKLQLSGLIKEIKGIFYAVKS